MTFRHDELRGLSFGGDRWDFPAPLPRQSTQDTDVTLLLDTSGLLKGYIQYRSAASASAASRAKARVMAVSPRRHFVDRSDIAPAWGSSHEHAIALESGVFAGGVDNRAAGDAGGRCPRGAGRPFGRQRERTPRFSAPQRAYKAPRMSHSAAPRAPPPRGHEHAMHRQTPRPTLTTTQALANNTTAHTNLGAAGTTGTVNPATTTRRQHRQHATANSLSPYTYTYGTVTAPALPGLRLRSRLPQPLLRRALRLR